MSCNYDAGGFNFYPFLRIPRMDRPFSVVLGKLYLRQEVWGEAPLNAMGKGWANVLLLLRPEQFLRENRRKQPSS